MTRPPRIGLTARSPRALVAYRRSLEVSRGQPVILAPWTPRPTLRQLYDTLDGVLLPGGAGIAWLWRQHHRSSGTPSRPRESWSELESADLQLARWALADRRPILGICRGIQMMALAVDGRLDRAVPGHRLEDAYPAHEIDVAPDSRLREILGARRMPVNSRHYRAVLSLPPESGLLPTAWAVGDGVVEGLEARDGVFAVGVQFHPENLVDVDAASRRLFERFVAACQRGGGW